MPSKVLETVLTGRNLLSPVLVGAARDVDAFDAKVTAAQARTAESASASASAQESAAAKVTAANARGAESASLASDKTVAANARAAESARGFAEVTESSTVRAGAAWARMATVGLPLVGAAVALVTGKMAGDYQQLVTKLETTAGETHANLAMVSQGMLAMAGQVGVSADELAKGMYTVESAGFHGADALKVLEAGAQGARQEQADLSHVVDAVTTSLHDYHLPATDAAKVTSELVAAVSHGKTTFDDLTGSMHSIEPVAVGAHLSIAQTAGSLAAMTASGMHADQAAQNLAHTIGSFQNATKPMRDELSQLGLDSTDLQQHMGERGIAGTLQLISDRIEQKVDPSGKLLLNALQTNKTAVSDLSIMIGQMPPQLADLATGLLAGTTTQKDFTAAAKGLGGQAGAMADQFLASYKGADGFSAALKSGGPMVQTYISALAKATGTSDGLRTALMLTGENAGSTNDAIAAVAGAAAQADGSIRGWDEVQGNFNQKLAEATAGAKSLAIEAGQHVLPVLTDVVGWVGDTGIPGIEHLGGAVGDAVGWFTKLPGPVKEAAGALAGLAIANKVGLFTALSSGVERLGAGVAAMPGKLQSFAGGWGPAAIGVAGITAAVMASNDEIDAWANGLEQGGKTARTATEEMTRAHDASILDAHSLGDAWTITKGAFSDGLAQLEGYSSALDAANQKAQDMYNAMPLQQRVQQDVTTAQNDLNQAIDDYGQNSSAAKYQAWLLGLANDSLKVNQQELKVAADGLNGSLAGQVSLQQQLAQSGVGLDQATLNTSQSISNYKKVAKDAKATDDDRASSLDNVAQSMFGVLDAAKRKADAETQGMPQSLITNQEIVRQRDALDAVVKKLGFVPPALQGMYDSLNGPTAQALQAAQTNVNNMGTAMTTVSNNDIGGTFLPALDKIAKAAGTTIPQAITGGFLPSTDQMAGKLNGPTVTALQGATSWMDYWTAQMSTGVPGAIQGPFAGALQQANGHMANTGGQAQTTAGQVAGLGQDIIGLPGSHNTVITADASQANNTIDAFLKRMQTDGFVGAAYNLTPLGAPASSSGLIGLPPVPHKATGGPIAGPGTGTSDSVLIAASNGEHMWTAAEVAAAGGHAGVEALRRSVLASGGGLAGGGPVPTSVAYPFDVNNGIKTHLAAQAAAAAAAAALTGGASAGGNPAMRALGQQIAANMGWASQFAAIDYVFSHESGWNPNAANPTSSAYGIPQFLNGTWAQYGGKTSSPGLQITDGINYMIDRYGSPNGAAAFWAAHHWYKDGTNYVPADQLAVLHKGEAVVPAAHNQGTPYQAGLNPATGTGHTATTMPGYGAVHVSVAPPQVHIYLDGQQWRGLARVEAETAIETLAVKIKDRMAGAGVGA